MQEINVEFDALFAIWKNRTEQAGEKITETAAETRRAFYTDFGWAGSNYDGRLTLKEIAATVRAYVKEKYPTCKFSIRTKYASMCQELLVEIKEFPGKMYMTADDLREYGLWDGTQYKPEVSKMFNRLCRNGYFNLSCWDDEDLIKAYGEACEVMNFYAIKTEYFQNVLDDVDRFVKSYNYEDCDAMIDYFDVNFYFFGTKFESCKQVSKVARVADKMPTAPAPQNSQPDQEQPKQLEADYTVTADTDTRDNSPLWVVKLKKYVDRQTFDAIRDEFKKIGGYYSRFKGGFIFREDPTGKIKLAA
ncbi:MAG: molecular chaperone DnaJ [Lachnospiraceae bacterium]|nr:molecular chaperone DnaJ [Lachnospiraceae bacterium]MBP3296702.1 molecular chaperone DnaJ [Lachnospiraceae bacterium]